MDEKKKLFSPEDFDKPERPSKSKNGYYLIGVLGIVLIFGIGYFSVHKGQKKSPVSDSLVTESVRKDSTTVDTIVREKPKVVPNKGADGDDTETKTENIQSNSPVSVEPTEKSQQMTDSENPSIGSVEAKAKQVIRGIYGNGSVRKQKLGNDYAEIQGKVNEMYRNGLVH